jgi:hypothetical protein
MSFLNVKVFPGSVKKSIIKKEDGSLEVRLPIAPEKGKANKVVIDMVADFFHTSASRVKIIKGARGKNKVFLIDD